MCLAFPARVIEVVPDQRAIVDLEGVRREISTALLDEVQTGDYVIVHVGYALSRLDRDEAERTIADLRIISADTRPADHDLPPPGKVIV